MATQTLPAHVGTLHDLGACREARQWAAGFADPQAAWDACERGDWMLWLVGRLAGRDLASPARRKVVMAAAECARLAPPIQGNAEWEAARVACLDVCERWGRGEDGVTLEDVRAARKAAAAADAAAAAYAADAYAYAAAAADASRSPQESGRDRPATLPDRPHGLTSTRRNQGRPVGAGDPLRSPVGQTGDRRAGPQPKRKRFSFSSTETDL